MTTIRVRLRPILAPAALAFALSGCATNALRLGYADDVAASGRTAAAASAAFLDRVEDARIAANVELAASDPNCLPLTAFVRNPPDLSRTDAAGAPARGWLCATTAEAGTVPLSMAPLGPEMQPTIALIGALGEYADGISDILAADGSAAPEDFAASLALLRAVGGTAGALGLGSADGGLLGPEDPRLPAIGEFIAFVTDLADEQRRVDQLRLLAGSSTGSAALIGTLQDHLSLWDIARRSDIALQATVASAVMSQSFRAEPPPIAETRRELISAYYARERGARGELRAYQVLGDMFDSLAAADRDMRRVLAEHPELTADERLEVARVLRARVTRAFETATTLLTAF